MKVTDIVEMNGHSKQTIYEAYSVEHHIRNHLNDELNKERRISASMKFDAMYWQDAYLETTVRYAVECEGDVEEALEYYFSHPHRHIAMTKSKGFYAFVDEGDHLFILFAYTNPKEWRHEYKDMPNLIKELASYGVPIRYTGVNNIMKNHSKEISPGLFELIL